MAVLKGTVKNNTIVLEQGVALPDGTHVEVRVVEPPPDRDELFNRIRAKRVNHAIGIDEIIAEEKKDIEERPDRCRS